VTASACNGLRGFQPPDSNDFVWVAPYENTASRGSVARSYRVVILFSTKVPRSVRIGSAAQIAPSLIMVNQQRIEAYPGWRLLRARPLLSPKRDDAPRERACELLARHECNPPTVEPRREDRQPHAARRASTDAGNSPVRSHSASSSDVTSTPLPAPSADERGAVLEGALARCSCRAGA
jgi:hypothetical protein